MPTAIDEILLSRGATDLETIRASGDLQQRYETKYVLTADSAVGLVKVLDPEWQVLEIERRRSTAYSSWYFDDDDFGLFYDHIQERRLRYKVRTRRYGNDPYEMLEIKLRTGRGATDKRRLERSAVLGPDLTDVERSWVTDVVGEAYRFRPSNPLRSALSLEYTRRTMFNPITEERLTIDTGIVAKTNSESTAPVGEAVVVEVKGVHWFGHTVRLLQRHSLRPLTFSKYCAAFASLYPEGDQRARQRAKRSFAQYADARGVA